MATSGPASSSRPARCLAVPRRGYISLSKQRASDSAGQYLELNLSLLWSTRPGARWVVLVALAFTPADTDPARQIRLCHGSGCSSKVLLLLHVGVANGMLSSLRGA